MQRRFTAVTASPGQRRAADLACVCARRTQKTQVVAEVRDARTPDARGKGSFTAVSAAAMASSNAMGKKKMSESSLASLDDPRFDFAIGDQMLCEWREERRQCEIIERRINSMTQQPQYYVHYAEFNRRLDEWVNRDRLHPLEAASSGKKAAGSGSGTNRFKDRPGREGSLRS